MTADPDVDEFYHLLDVRVATLTRRFSGRLPTAADLPLSKARWTEKGVYFFFEPGESRESGDAPRVVRVGSHTGGRSTVESRIVSEHAVDWGRSVFRRHVGGALIRSGRVDRFLPSTDRERWAQSWIASRRKRAVHHRRSELDPALHFLHSHVTGIVRQMTFVWVKVEELDTRLKLEKEVIRLLSNCHRACRVVDSASAAWLGRFAYPEEIRLSGLWNVQQVRRPPTPGFVRSFASYFESDD